MNENEKQGGKAAAQGRQMADTTQQVAQEGTRRIKEITNEAAEAGQHAVTATAEAARVGAETMQQTLQAGLDVAYKVAQRSNDEFLQVLGLSGQQSQELAQQSSQNVQAIANT